MLNERKLTENELEQRKIALKGLLKNKRALVKKYGADAEKVMYGIATKQAKKKIEKMNLENLRSMIKDALTQPVKEQSPFVLAADAARDAGKKEFEFPKGSGKMHPVTIKTDIKEDIEESEVDEAIMDLRNLVDQIEDTADEAREIVRRVFPNELSRLDAYGVFNAMYSANRYDTTLGKFVDRLEEEGYEIEDGVAYVNEANMMPMDDLDVGHIDDEPGMLKSELARAGKMIQMLYRAIDKYDGKGEVDFPQWWQKKIIQANAMLDSAFDYLDGKESVAKIDAMIDTIDEEKIEVDADTEFILPLKHLIKKHVKEIVGEKKLTAAEKNKKEDIIKGIAKQKGGKKKLEPVDYAVATDRAKKLAEKNDQ